MDEATEDLLSGGYCFSIRHSGPFVVGEDFEAPGPAARVLPNLPTDPQTWEKLWAHIPKEDTAGSDEGVDQSVFKDSVRQLEFKNGVNEALRWYVSDAAFQADVPDVRKQLSALKRNIECLNEQLPDETTTLGHFLSKTYAGTCFLRIEQQPTEPQLIALQDHWRDRVGFLLSGIHWTPCYGTWKQHRVYSARQRLSDIERGRLFEGSRAFGRTQSDAGRRAAGIRSKALKPVRLPISCAQPPAYFPRISGLAA